MEDAPEMDNHLVVVAKVKVKNHPEVAMETEDHPEMVVEMEDHLEDNLEDHCTTGTILGQDPPTLHHIYTFLLPVTFGSVGMTTVRRLLLLRVH